MAYSKHTNPKRFLDVLSSLQVSVQPFSMSLSEDDSLCPSSGLKTRWPCRHTVVVYKSKVLFLDYFNCWDGERKSDCLHRKIRALYITMMLRSRLFFTCSLCHIFKMFMRSYTMYFFRPLFTIFFNLNLCLVSLHIQQ